MLIKEIIENTEYLSTTEGDSIPCISIENLAGILARVDLITTKEREQLEKETV